MRKSIKKICNILIGTLAVVILLFFSLFIALRLPSVQTFLVKKITSFISNDIKATVSVGKVNFTFLNKIELQEVLIKDKNNDTLIYVPFVNAGIRQINRKTNTIKLGKVVVMNPVVAFISDSSGLMNLNWYLDLIQKPGDTVSAANSYFHINQIDISGGRFSLINKGAGPSGTPIDFNNLRLTGINGIVENLDVRNDSTSLDIYKLGFAESSGFVVRKLSSELTIRNQNIIFRNISLQPDSSMINADQVAILADSSGSFQRFTDEVRLDISLKKSVINSNDLKYFVSFLKDFNESAWISGRVSGTISELKGRNIQITYKNDTYLDCNFDLSGLPDIKNTFIFFDVNDFRSISKDIEQIRIPGKGNILLPAALRKLGVVSFTGSFTGFATDFVTYGKIHTNKGVISTDVSLRPSGSGKYKVKGLVKGSDIDLGSITDNPEMFGSISMEANIDGTSTSFEEFAVNLSGKIDSIEINRYKYRNIALNGLFNNKAWDGTIKIEDKNIHMDLLGSFDFNKKLPEFDFTLNLIKANLFKLNIDKSDTSSAIKILLTANLIGNNIDNLVGEIKLLNSNLVRYGNNLNIYDFTIKTYNQNSTPTINIRTDFLDANLYGKHNFRGIGDIIRNRLADLMPSNFTKGHDAATPTDNVFVFDINFKHTDEINNFFRTGITLSEDSYINGTFYPDSVISFSGKSGMFSINSNTFTNLSFEGSSSDTISNIKVASSSAIISGLSEIKNLKINFASIPDKFNFYVDWGKKDETLNNGTLIANGIFEKTFPQQKNAILKLDFQPADIYVRNNLWKISPSEILIDSSSIKVNKLSVRNIDNYFLVDGSVSVDPLDTMYLEFNGIGIDPLNRMYEKGISSDPTAIKLNLGGILNGKISLTNIYREFMFESNIKVKDFTILGGRFGDIKLVSAWNNNKKVADIFVNSILNGKKLLDISGIYDPGTSVADLSIETNSLPIDFLNPLLSTFASGITGTASGKLKFLGNFNTPLLTGAVFGENASMKIDYLQTKFTFNDSIRFDNSGISFRNIQAKDDKGNTADLNGTVFNKYFKDFSVDLTIRSNDCMVLNTRPKDNDLFYGTAFATGVTTLKSKGSGLSFNISAKTGKNTRFFIPLNSGSSVSDKSFINFVEVKRDNKSDNQPLTSQAAVSSKSSIDINFDLDITPDAEVQLIFDSKAGDVMKGTGKGNLNISLNPKGDFKMYGDYVIEDGDYLFTLGSLLNKRFIVQSGGKIAFNGDISDADIDIKAVYKTKAPLSEIMPDVPDPKLKERIPVECLLNLSGNLFKPMVGFDIYLPTADEETRAYLRSMIKSEEEMSRQFLFLLVMNSFYADPNARTSPTTSDIGTTTVGVTTTEMLSNQLSNWLSQISNDFDIGVNYRPGSTALPNSQEVQVALSTQILNDKVIINGNFDYGTNQVNSNTTTGNNAITGAFDVEVKITDKIRFKVFNRSNDNFYIDNGVQYTQGVSLFYKQDFNRFKDLFSKPEKKNSKKTAKADSTKIHPKN
jgi:hypothetical protein